MRRRLILLAALIIIPFMAEAQKAKAKGTAIVAHRGYWNCEKAGYAKNSLAALQCAQEAGFWGSEFDVNMTADGVLIVFHDSKIKGKKIEKHPFEEFKDYRLKNGEPIPTIDQYLEQGRKHPETVLVYELKKHSCDEVEDLFVDLSIEKLKQYDLLDPSKVIFISFSYHMCKRLAEKLPDFTVQFLSGTKEPAKVMEDGINGIDYNYKTLKLNKKWVKKAKKLGMSTNTWTVNTLKDMEAIFKMKVGMITSDYPQIVRELLSSKRIKERVFTAEE